ncbi:MAG: hypothetical protein LBQ02_01535 [Candidatus Nomurabacteria bacterium]|jgi:hypothetical protein|nr:hypothetical protein [Candidatus Nomurabacteria bacterium]
MTKTSKLIAGLTLVAGFGVAALPLSTYADMKTQDVLITVGVVDTAAIEDPGTVGDNVESCTNPDGGEVELVGLNLGSDAGKGACAISISSNEGYKLSIKGSASTNPTSLTSGTNTIGTIADTTFSGSAASSWGTGAALVPSTDAWGYNVAKSSTVSRDSINSIFTVESTDRQVDSSATQASGVVYTFGFAVTAPVGQAQGSYSGQVTLTVETL